MKYLVEIETIPTNKLTPIREMLNDIILLMRNKGYKIVDCRPYREELTKEQKEEVLEFIHSE